MCTCTTTLNLKYVYTPKKKRKIQFQDFIRSVKIIMTLPDHIGPKLLLSMIFIKGFILTGNQITHLQ